MSHQERVGGLAGLDGFLAPRAAPALWLAEAPQVVGLAEPDAGLRLTAEGISIGPTGRVADFTELRFDLST